MIDEKEVENLANLCRIELPESEKIGLRADLESILNYVSQLRSVFAKGADSDDSHINVLRDDAKPHDSGIHTDEIMSCVPNKKDGYVVVKQVIEEKKKIKNQEL